MYLCNSLKQIKMKKVLFAFMMMFITSLSFGQVNEQSQLDKLNNYVGKTTLNLDKFAKQNQQGNRYFLGGLVTTIIGSLIFSNGIANASQQDYKITGGALILAGSAFSTAGVVLRMDSFRHLRIK